MFDRVNDLYVELENSGATVAVITTINHTLLNWLLNHVRITDKKLGQYLANATGC